MSKRRIIKGWPVMKSKCASCPFADGGDRELMRKVVERTGLGLSQICHHPKIHHKPETHLCRCARDHQLILLHKLNLIAAPTEEAFTLASQQEGVL